MKKVNIKKHIKQIIAWMILGIVLAFSVSFSNARKDSVLCKHIRINIKGNEKNSLITKEEISTSLEDKKYKLKGYPLFRINTKQLEEEMEQYPQIKEVEIYAKMDSSLNFEIYQRNPVIRIMKQDGEDFFIDEDGVIISVINNHPSHVLLANGHIGFNLEKEKAVFNITDTIHKGNEIEVLKNLYQLAVFIDENQFWKHQIEQIYVNK
ncbi:MAG: cell division protein FtsQ/DivIB, partial [Bacteroidota bacterium]